MLHGFGWIIGSCSVNSCLILGGDSAYSSWLNFQLHFLSFPLSCSVSELLLPTILCQSSNSSQKAYWFFNSSCLKMLHWGSFGCSRAGRAHCSSGASRCSCLALPLRLPLPSAATEALVGLIATGMSWVQTLRCLTFASPGCWRAFTGQWMWTCVGCESCWSPVSSSGATKPWWRWIQAPTCATSSSSAWSYSTHTLSAFVFVSPRSLPTPLLHC